MIPAAVPALVAGPTDAAAALRLLASVLAGRTLDDAARRLAAALGAADPGSQVAIGLLEHHRLELVALSGADRIDRGAEPSRLMAGAMHEALEQAVAIAEPAEAAAAASGAAGAPRPGDATATPPSTIRREHEVLVQRLGGAVASWPLATEGEAFGAVCIHRSDPRPFGAVELERLEHVLALAAPALQLLHLHRLGLRAQWRRSLAGAWAALRRPSRRLQRGLLAGACAALALLATVPIDRNVGGRARIEGIEQRVLVAPTDGFVGAARARPGDRVRAGAPLADLEERELRLEQERWASQRAQHENGYAAAMARADRTQAAVSLARLQEAQAQLALIDAQLGRRELRAPFDGIVVDGDLAQAVGAPVRQGDTLLTLASTAGFRVVVQVDEADIARVAVGQAGRVQLSSLPWDEHRIVAERIAPLALAVEGRNVFEVHARLDADDPRLRPGLIGRADLVVGRQPPLWDWLGKAIDRLRLAAWSWLG